MVGGGRARLGTRRPGRRLKVPRCVVRSLLFAPLLALGGCDASTQPSSREPEPGAGSHRTIAFAGVDSLTIVSFDDPENPRPFELFAPGMGYRRLRVEWSLDGRGLTVVSRTEDPSLNEGFLFSSENWSAPRRAVSDGIFSLLWVDADRYIAVGSGWTLSDLRTGSSTTTPASQLGVTQWPADGGYSYLIRSDDAYDWIHPKRDPVRIRNADVLSYFPTSEGDSLVLVYQGDSDPDVSDNSHVLSMRAAPQAGCTPRQTPGDCLPQLRAARRIPETSLVLIAAWSQGAGGVWRSILVRGWGENTSLSTGADEPGVLRASGPDKGEECGPVVVEDRIWIFCVLPGGGASFERFETTQQGLRSAYAVNLASPGAVVLRTEEDNVIIGRIEAEDGPSENWQVLDLRHDVEAWAPVDPKGDVVVGMGRRGAIFLDSPDDPRERSTPCAPCAFTAVQDILDPKSPRLTGSVHASSSPDKRDVNFPLWPAPDGSGVLIRESGTWFYEMFDKPGTRYPIATPPEGALISLPPRWGE